MCSFIDDLLLHTGYSVEDDGPRAALDVVDTVLSNHTPNCKGEGHAVYILEHVGHGVELEGDGMRSESGDDCFSVTVRTDRASYRLYVVVLCTPPWH